MSVKINDILLQLRTQLATLSNLTASRIEIGPVLPARVQQSSKPIVTIVESREPGSRIDGGNIERDLVVEVGVLMRVNTASATDVDLQINDTYSPIHALLETLVDGLDGFFLTMKENDPGPESESVFASVPIRIKSCSWTIKFERTMGQTD